jgi:hypothetical protein
MARTLQRLRELDELDPKLGPQEEIIFDLITDEATDRLDILEKLTAKLEADGYEGAQTPEGMLSYYQASLQKRRLVQVDGKADPGSRTARTKNNLFVRLRELDELDTKLSPMEAALFDLIPAEGIMRTDLIAAIEAAKTAEEITTKQDSVQVVGLYHRDLMNRRLIAVEDPSKVEDGSEDSVGSGMADA